MKKNKLLLNFIISFLGWGIPMGLIFFIMFGSLKKGVILGGIGGFVFAAFMILFVVILASRKDKLRERYGIEGAVVYDGAANHMVNKNAVGGWIFLMEDRFYFAAHAVNMTTGVWMIPYSDITDVTRGKMVRSIAVHTKGGIIEEFVVDNRDEWIHILQERCGKEG